MLVVLGLAIYHNVLRVNTPEKVRLVRGSHIVVPKLGLGKCYFFKEMMVDLYLHLRN